MAEEIVLSESENLAWLKDVARHLWQPGHAFKFSARKNGFRNLKRSLRHHELQRLIQTIVELDLPRKFQTTSGKPELVVFETNNGRDPTVLIRLTPRHLPTSAAHRKSQYLRAETLFRTLANHPSNIQVLRELKLID